MPKQCETAQISTRPFSRYMIASGAGESAYRLVAFDSALADAGISNYNLVRVSSILPPGTLPAGEVGLPEGSALHVAYAVASSDREGERIAAAVAVGLPADSGRAGVIMEATGASAAEAEEAARAMVAEAMENRGLPVLRIESSSVEGAVRGCWLSLVSAVVLW